jgi:hypothetical protein
MFIDWHCSSGDLYNVACDDVVSLVKFTMPPVTNMIYLVTLAIRPSVTCMALLMTFTTLSDWYFSPADILNATYTVEI